MCNRFNLRTSAKKLSSLFQASFNFDPPIRYNVAPTQLSPVCRLDGIGEKEIVPLKWGLIPPWTIDEKRVSTHFNARSETVAEQPSFRYAFKQRRCLVPVSGFFEWLTVGKTKHPFHIHRDDDAPFAIAGLWESWKGIETFSLVTTAANSFMQTVHDRMPVVLEPEMFAIWLAPHTEPRLLKSIMAPRDWEHFSMYEVSSVVNKWENDSPACLTPVGTATDE